MSTAPLPTASAYPPPPYYYPEPARWAFPVVALVLLLVPVIIVSAILLQVFFGGMPYGMMTTGDRDWIVGLVGLLIAVIVIVAVLRVFVSGLFFPGYYAADRWARRAYRHGYYAHGPWGPWGVDPALTVARDRYARGEISHEEYDRIVRDLTQTPGSA